MSRIYSPCLFLLQYSLRAHPNVVTVLGILRDPAAGAGGVLGIVMERCACSLADILYGARAPATPKLPLLTKLDTLMQARQRDGWHWQGWGLCLLLPPCL